MATDLYAILQVEEDASDVRIRSAYLEMARRYHPDLNLGDDVVRRQFQRVVLAYEILSDPVKRRLYDSDHNYASSALPRASNGEKRHGNARDSFPAVTASDTPIPLRVGLRAMQKQRVILFPATVFAVAVIVFVTSLGVFYQWAQGHLRANRVNLAIGETANSQRDQTAESTVPTNTEPLQDDPVVKVTHVPKTAGPPSNRPDKADAPVQSRLVSATNPTSKLSSHGNRSPGAGVIDPDDFQPMPAEQAAVFLTPFEPREQPSASGLTHYDASEPMPDWATQAEPIPDTMLSANQARDKKPRNGFNPLDNWLSGDDPSTQRFRSPKRRWDRNDATARFRYHFANRLLAEAEARQSARFSSRSADDQARWSGGVRDRRFAAANRSPYAGAFPLRSGVKGPDPLLGPMRSSNHGNGYRRRFPRPFPETGYGHGPPNWTSSSGGYDPAFTSPYELPAVPVFSTGIPNSFDNF